MAVKKPESDRHFKRGELTPMSMKCEQKLYQLKKRWLKGKTLDLGCGNGEFLELHENSIGIDAHPLAISNCKKKGLKVIQGDIHALAFKTGIFDSVHCNSVLDHCDHPDEVLKEICRVIKPNGTLYLTVNDISKRKWKFYDDYTHKFPFTKRSIIDLLEDSGFDIVKVGYIPYIPRFFARSGHLPLRLFRLFTRMCGKIFKRQVEIIAKSCK